MNTAMIVMEVIHRGKCFAENNTVVSKIRNCPPFFSYSWRIDHAEINAACGFGEVSPK